VWTLVVIPLFILSAAAVFVSATPPTSTIGYLTLAVGAVAGAGLGYVRGIHTRATLGPRPATLVVQGNIVLVVILVAAFAARFVVRVAVGAHGPLGTALSDAFLVFAAVSVAVARGMLLVKWRQLDGARRAITMPVA
jgi:hypothetical protein